MKESQFTTEIINSLEFFGFYAYKIADMPNAARRVIKFIPVKPCDVISCSPKGRFIGIECKIIKKWQGMNRGIVRDTQINALDKIVKNNGRAFIMVNYRIENTSTTKRFNKTVIFDWKIHRDNIIEGKYKIKEMRAMSKGHWIDSHLTSDMSDAKTKKRCWELRDFLIYKHCK